MSALRRFFFENDRATPFALAEKWGLTMNTDLSAFGSLFEKFVT